MREGNEPCRPGLGVRGAGRGRLRCQVPTCYRKGGEFRDFVVTRIEAPIMLTEEPQASEHPDNKIQWTSIVELDVVLHPRHARPEIIKMHCRMTSGSTRSAFALRLQATCCCAEAWAIRPPTVSTRNGTACR